MGIFNSNNWKNGRFIFKIKVTVLSKQKAWRGSIYSEEVGLKMKVKICIFIRAEAQERLHLTLLSHVHKLVHMVLTMEFLLAMNSHHFLSTVIFWSQDLLQTNATGNIDAEKTGGQIFTYPLNPWPERSVVWDSNLEHGVSRPKVHVPPLWVWRATKVYPSFMSIFSG